MGVRTGYRGGAPAEHLQRLTGKTSYTSPCWVSPTTCYIVPNRNFELVRPGFWPCCIQTLAAQLPLHARWALELGGLSLDGAGGAYGGRTEGWSRRTPPPPRSPPHPE